jgi:serine/threonine protein kinase
VKVNDAAHDATLTASYDIDEAVRASRPARVGRYEVGEALGSGSMGVVYRARDPELDRAVAIKLVRTDASSSSSGVRLLREAQAMAKLRHPNVVPIFDVGPADGAVFVAMPLLEGGTLRTWLRTAEHSLDAILDRFVAAGRGLAAAHAAGLIHRDFKPDNVLLGVDGEVHVADFGLARLADVAGGPPPALEGSEDTATRTGEVVGTPAYMAPEQLRGRASDARADQFSFCISLWEGVYGQRPFPRMTPSGGDPLRARLHAIAAGPIAPQRRDRPAWLAQVLTRGLAEDPEQRWPNMQALLDAICVHRAPRRWPWRLAAVLGALSLAAAMIAIGWPAHPPPQLRQVRLTHRGDLKGVAAISPDGSQLAMVAGDSLVLRGVEADAEDRVLIDHGVDTEPLSWSPDGRYLIASTSPETIGMIHSEMIEIRTARRTPLPGPGMAVFLSSSEVAVASHRQRFVTIHRIADRSARPQRCDVPGDYTFVWSLTGMPDGTIVVETVKDQTRSLVILRRDCQVRATYAGEPISSIATSDTGTIVGLVVGEGYGDVLELSVDGKLLSRRRVAGDPWSLIGRRRGVDYVSIAALKTRLDRVRRGEPPLPQFSVSGSASFSLAPDGATLAWIELGGQGRGPGRLRLATLQDLPRRGRALLGNALMAGWSPDGRSLAVLVDDHDAVSVVVIDRGGTVLRRLPLRGLEREAAPVWLDDHRVACQTDDRKTYRWFDLDTGEQGELTDTQHGSTYWLARSPRDGTLAMWRMGPPDALDARTEHLWIMPAGGEPRPVHVGAVARHYLLPSWSPDGELLVRALDTGVVSRVALDTGEVTPFAQLVPTPTSRVFDDHLMILADGDLLAVEIDLGISVVAIRPDDTAHPASPMMPEQM